MKDKLYITFLPTYVAPEILPEPETTAYMTNADVNIPNDDTVYFNGTDYQITGAGLWAALDNFVIAVKNSLGLALQSLTLQDHFKYIYPRIGGTATAHRINLVDTSTFIGTFSGGWTHDGSGALPNGTNGYMNTGCTYGTANFTSANQSFGICLKTNSLGLYADVGSITGGYSNILMYPRRDAGNFGTRCDDQTVNNTVNTNSIGLFAVNRVLSTEYDQFVDGSLFGTITSNSTILATPAQNAEEIFLAALNNGGSATQYSNRKQTLAYAGLGMTDTQVSELYTAWNTLETTLNR